MLANGYVRTLFVLTLVASAWAQSGPSSTGQGVITGVVLTENSELATSAKVCLAQRNGNNTTINCRYAVDKDARFTIEHLAPRTYQVFAIDDAEGYSLDMQSPGDDVIVSAAQPVVDITVRLKAKGGILTGTITDKVTGQVIRNPSIRYISIDRDGSGGSQFVNGKTFIVPVPSNSDLLVVVMATGYKGWVYTDPGDASRPLIRLGRGERKELNVQLEPLQPGTPPPNVTQ